MIKFGAAVKPSPAEVAASPSMLRWQGFGARIDLLAGTWASATNHLKSVDGRAFRRHLR
jgi:hypothetical protein